MASNLLCYQLLLVILVLLCLMIHIWWPDNPKATLHRPLKPDKPRRKRAKEPKPFPGLIHKPLCETCEQGADTLPKAPGSLPPVLTFSRGRQRTVNTHAHWQGRRWSGRDWGSVVAAESPAEAPAGIDEFAAPHSGGRSRR